MMEALSALVGILLALTVFAAFEYYRQLRRAHREYERAREVVDDIILSFSRQLDRESKRLELVAYKVEAVSSKADKNAAKTDDISKSVHSLEGKVESALRDRDVILARISDVEEKMRDVTASHEKLASKVSKLEEQAQQLAIIPEAKVETAIPIKRDKVLAPLTETELSVLEMLSREGPKTAPEIKERIKLSREHTARLMKKLYEEGYLERDTSKIPFKYHVKAELEKLLKKD